MSVNDPFQYLLDAAPRAQALARVRRSLVPGGRLLLDMANFAWILAHRRPPPERHALVDGISVHCRPRHEVDEAARVWTHVDDYEIVFPDGRREGARLVHRLAMIEPPEILAMLVAAGFSAVETWPAWSATSPGPPDGPRLIVTASGGAVANGRV